MADPKYVQAPFNIPGDFAIELQKAGELLDVGNEAQQIGHTLISTIQTMNCDTEYKFVAYFIFTKALKTAQSAQVLCRCGYGSDGLSLCAVLFENLVDLLYVGTAPRRARRYCQFENVEKYYQACKVLRQKRLPEGRRRIYRQYERDLLSEVKPLLRYFPNRSRGWSQKTLAERARAIKAGLPYQELYWIFCAHKHTLPMVATGLAIETTGGNLSLTTGPDMKSVCHAAEQSTTLLLKICLVIDKVFGLSARTEVERSLKKLVACRREIVTTDAVRRVGVLPVDRLRIG